GLDICVHRSYCPLYSAPATGNRLPGPCGSAVNSRVRWAVNALQPRLSPVREDLSRAEEASRAALSRADGTFQLDAVVANPEHATGVLFDDLGDPPPNLHHLAAKRDHLNVEAEPAVVACRGERRLDLLPRLHPHPLPGLQVERLGSRWRFIVRPLRPGQD